MGRLCQLPKCNNYYAKYKKTLCILLYFRLMCRLCQLPKCNNYYAKYKKTLCIKKRLHNGHYIENWKMANAYDR